MNKKGGNSRDERQDEKRILEIRYKNHALSEVHSGLVVCIKKDEPLERSHQKKKYQLSIVYRKTYINQLERRTFVSPFFILIIRKKLL